MDGPRGMTGEEVLTSLTKAELVEGIRSCKAATRTGNQSQEADNRSKAQLKRYKEELGHRILKSNDTG